MLKLRLMYRWTNVIFYLSHSLKKRKRFWDVNMKNVLDPTSEENRCMEKELKKQLKKKRKTRKWRERRGWRCKVHIQDSRMRLERSSSKQTNNSCMSDVWPELMNEANKSHSDTLETFSLKPARQSHWSCYCKDGNPQFHYRPLCGRRETSDVRTSRLKSF